MPAKSPKDNAARKPALKPAKRNTSKRGGPSRARFTDAEQAAMKERARELKAEASTGKNKADGQREVLAKIDEMPEPDRTLARRLHAIITATAPALAPKLWYGMPAYANPPPPAGDGKVVCFFQAATKFKTRYATFAFTDSAKLDDGLADTDGLWPTGFGLKALTAAEETKIRALVKKAVG